MSADQTPTLAGKYILLRKLAAGGMAEVHLARQVGLEGFEKLVVLKRIQPQFAEDPEFVTMFLDEARTAADLRHPNVVDIYEVGSHEGNYFIAMEYIHGQSVRKLQRDLTAKGVKMPLALAAHIVIESARGLDYAHKKADLQGMALGIVHRDVSPQNILVSFQGETKIVDFGIARAASRSRQTAPGGGLFGKLDYMSPEQALGGPIGPRSDLFSLAIILFELTTGRRLFWHESDAMTIRNVIACQIPKPSSVSEGFPEELEELLVKALSPTPDHRHAGCKELADALEEWLAKAGLPHSDTRIGEFLRELYPEEWKEMPAPIPVSNVSTSVRTVAGMARPVLEGAGSFVGDAPTGGYDPMNPPATRQTPTDARPVAPTVPRPADGWERGSPSPGPPRRTPNPFSGAMGSWKPFVLGIVATLLAGVGGWFVLGQVRDKEVYARAGVLMSKGENVTALEVLHTRLQDDPGSYGLREMAIKAANSEIDRRAKIDAEDALDWLEGQLEDRPYLEPLRKRIPTLGVIVLIEEMDSGKIRGGWRADKIWEFVQAHPDDADAPYIAAGLIGRTRIVDASLPFYEEAIRRGHVAGPEVWDDCREAFEKNTPDEWAVSAAIKLCRASFPAEIDKWTEAALLTGGTYSWLNAIQMRTLRDEPAITGDAFLQAVLRYGGGMQRDGDEAIIAAEPDRARGERARDAFQEIRATFATSREASEAAKAILPVLEKRWPEPVASPAPSATP